MKQDDTYYYASPFKNVYASGKYGAISHVSYCKRLDGQHDDREDHFAGGIEGWNGSEISLLEQSLEASTNPLSRKPVNQQRKLIVFRSMVAHIPSTIGIENLEAFSKEYCAHISKLTGSPVAFDIHIPKKGNNEPENWHIHLRVYNRQSDGKTYTKKNKVVQVFQDRKKQKIFFENINSFLAQEINEYTKRKGLTTRTVSHLSNDEKIKTDKTIQEPKKHISDKVLNLEMRKTKKTKTQIIEEQRKKSKPTRSQKKYSTNVLPPYLVRKFGLTPPQEWYRFSSALADIDFMSGKITKDERDTIQKKIKAFERTLNLKEQDRTKIFNQLHRNKNFNTLEDIKELGIFISQRSKLSGFIKDRIVHPIEKLIEGNKAAKKESAQEVKPERVETPKEAPKPQPETPNPKTMPRWFKHNAQRTNSEAQQPKAPIPSKIEPEARTVGAGKNQPEPQRTPKPQPASRFEFFKKEHLKEEQAAQAIKAQQEQQKAEAIQKVREQERRALEVMKERQKAQEQEALERQKRLYEKRERLKSQEPKEEEVREIKKPDPIQDMSLKIHEKQKQEKEEHEETVFDKLKKGKPITPEEFKNLDHKKRIEFMKLKKELDEKKNTEVKKNKIKSKIKDDFIR